MRNWTDRQDQITGTAKPTPGLKATQNRIREKMTMPRPLPTRPIKDWPTKMVRSYAYRAIERDTMTLTGEEQAAADTAMTRLFNREMPTQELRDWAWRELEFRMLTED